MNIDSENYEYKYSFLVPVYNVECYLTTCIESIKGQNYRKNKYEIILVDDGSTDSSGVICDRYSDKYDNIKVIHQDNSGLLKARGTGVRNSTGEYLIFVDSDDYIENNLLTIVDEFVELYNPDFLNYGFVKEKKGKETLIPVTACNYELLDNEKFLRLFVGSERYNSVCSKVIRGNILRNIADEIYNKRVNIGEDKIQTSYLIRESRKIILIKPCLYHYVSRDDSIVHLKTEKDVYDVIDVYQRVENVILTIMNSLNFTEQDCNEILGEYRGGALDGTLDHIYKYDTRRDIGFQEKSVTLNRVYESRKSFFYEGKRKLTKVKCYNSVRLLLFNRRRKLLIVLDSLIARLRGIATEFGAFR